VFIGPEGGWTDDEVENGRSAGLIPVTLGKRILRAETAAIVAAALVMQQLDS
jgi:16S rRNA (uracil1498-N3)-methyltransferase